MAEGDIIAMSQKELKRLHVIHKATEGQVFHFAISRRAAGATVGMEGTFMIYQLLSIKVIRDRLDY